jgi:hypothetical protein
MSLSAFYEAMAAKARRDETKDDAHQTVERPKSAAQRERERAELRADMQEGARMAREYAARQASRQPDRETDYQAWCTEMAHRITDAGRRARGLKPLFSDDKDDQSPEYPPGNRSPGDPTDPDDGPNPKDKRGKKKTKKVQDEDEPVDAEDDEDAEDKPSKPRDRGDGDENTNDDEKRRGPAYPAPGESVTQYWRRVDRTAASIVAAAKRRRGET